MITQQKARMYQNIRQQLNHGIIKRFIENISKLIKTIVHTALKRKRRIAIGNDFAISIR